MLDISHAPPPNTQVLIEIPIEKDKVENGRKKPSFPYRYEATKKMRHISGYGRLDSRRRWQLLPNPWKGLFYKVWRRLDKIFKGEFEYTTEFRLYLFELVWSFVVYRRSIENEDTKDTMVDIKFRDIDKWRDLLARAIKVQERKRTGERNLAIAQAVLGTVEEVVTDQVLKDRLRSLIVERLEQALLVEDKYTGQGDFKR